MDINAKIYVAGHGGLVGSAITARLGGLGYINIISKTCEELDLTNQKNTETFFAKERPEYVFLAAARVGGIFANNTYRAEFIYQNIMISANVTDAAYKHGAKKLLNLGSSCIYPKLARQPLKEEYLLTGSLEPTNEPYAIAKIAAIKLCKYYNEQYDTDFISVMPTNLYGRNDNFDLQTSHVLPAFIRKFHLAKLLRDADFEGIEKDFKTYGNFPENEKKNMSKNDIVKILDEFGITGQCVTLWGSGSPYREFLYVDELADACVFLMQKYTAKEIGEVINIGTGKDIRIKELASMIKEIVGFNGTINWDKSRPDGTPKKVLDVSRINKLGWESKTALDEALRTVYGYYVSQ